MGIFVAIARRERGVKQAMSGQKRVIDETLSLEQVPEFHSRPIALGHHGCIE